MRVAEQDDPGLFDTPTPGYVSVDAQIAWRPFTENRNIEFALSGHNLADEVVRVEHPPGVFRVHGGLHDGDVGPSADLGGWPGGRPVEMSWEQWGSEVFLIPAPGSTGEAIEVRYKGAYSVPADDVTALDVETEDEEALVLMPSCFSASAATKKNSLSLISGPPTYRS